MHKKNFILLLLFLALLDRVFKIIALLNFSAKNIFGNFFTFSYFKNDQMAFSLSFIDQQTIIIVTFFLLFILLYLFIKALQTHKFNFSCAYALIIVGACSNLYDRFFYQSVIDYFFLYPFSYFNIADLLIGTGIIWLGILLFKK